MNDRLKQILDDMARAFVDAGIGPYGQRRLTHAEFHRVLHEEIGIDQYASDAVAAGLTLNMADRR